MKTVFNIAILISVVVCLGLAIGLFGGVLPEYAIPFYASATAVMMVWGLKWMFCRHASWVWSPLHIPVILFVTYTAARYLQSPIEHVSRLELIHVALYVLVYFTVANNLHRDHDRTTLFYAVLIFAVADALYGLWQYRTGNNYVLWLDRGDDYRGRAGGTYYCPNHLAGLLEMALGLIVARIVVDRHPLATLQETVVRRLYETAALIAIGLGLYVTFSRGGWIASGVSLLVMLIAAELTRAVSSRLAITVFVAVGVATAVLWSVPSVRTRVEQSVGIDLGYRIGERPLDVRGGFVGRTPFWQSTLAMIRDYPVTGTGPATWQWLQLQYRRPQSQLRPQYAHSDVLQLTAEYGAVGLLIVIVAFACFYWQASQLAARAEEPQQRAFAIGALTAVSAILVHSFVDFNLHIPANALLVVILFGAIAAQGRNGRRSWRGEAHWGVRLVCGMMLLIISAAGGWAAIAIARGNQFADRGYQASQEHEWDEALENYWCGLDYDARSPELHALIGDVYRVQSDLITNPELLNERRLIARKAMDAYARSLELNPYHSEVMLKQAAACELAGDQPAAFRWYQQSLLIDPNNAFNWICIGVFYQNAGDTNKAVAALQRAQTLNPSDPTASQLLLRYP